MQLRRMTGGAIRREADLMDRATLNSGDGPSESIIELPAISIRFVQAGRAPSSIPAYGTVTIRIQFILESEQCRSRNGLGSSGLSNDRDVRLNVGTISAQHGVCGVDDVHFCSVVIRVALPPPVAKVHSERIDGHVMCLRHSAKNGAKPFYFDRFQA